MCILSLLPISLSPSVRLWRQGHLDDILLAMSLAASCWSETMFIGTVSFCGGRKRRWIGFRFLDLFTQRRHQTGKKYFRNSCLPCTSRLERECLKDTLPGFFGIAQYADRRRDTANFTTSVDCVRFLFSPFLGLNYQCAKSGGCREIVYRARV